MDLQKISKAVDDLISDYERTDGFLSKSNAERLFEKRALTVEECSEVYCQLSNLGISLEDEQQPPGAHEIVDSEEQTSHATEDLKRHLAAIDGRYNKQHKLLTHEEEISLGRIISLGHRAEQELQNGTAATNAHRDLIDKSRGAKSQLVESNARLVMDIAKQYAGFGTVEFEDLIQEGMMGLMKAIEKYDYALGYRFSTYATWWIRQAITRALANMGSTIRLPVHAHDDVIRFRRAYRLLGLVHPERVVSSYEIAKELVWPVEKVHFIQQISRLNPVSLNEPIAADGLTLTETLVSELATPEESYEDSDLVKIIQEVLGTLPIREKNILEMRFGLDDSGGGKTLEEIGKIYNLTRERIRQLEAKALRKMRHPSRSDKLHDFL